MAMGPRGRVAGRAGGQRAGRQGPVCTRCGKPITGDHWTTLVGRVLHPECTQGWTYLSDQLQQAERGRRLSIGETLRRVRRMPADLVGDEADRQED